MLRIDHVVRAVRDLQASADRLWEEHGLRFEAGGRHPAWGTANMIAPLGDDYLELLGVVDHDVGRETMLGRTVLAMSAEGDRWYSVCLADDELDATAERLWLSVEPGARTRPDGSELRWRAAGLEERGNDLWLPFFIDWDAASGPHPGAAPPRHRIAVDGIRRVDVGGDEARLRAWLGGRDAPIRVVDGAAGVRSVALALAGGGELEIGP